MTGHEEWGAVDTVGWLQDQAPGVLISSLLTTVGRGKCKINQTSFQRNTETWDLDRMRGHLSEIKAPGFNTKTYDQKGYVLRGTITTNEFRLNLEAFKIKELQSARYKRLSPDKLPSRLTSTVAGTSDYLTEICHVIRSRDDVQSIWNCDPSDIKIVGIDLGQAYVAGVSALLPDHNPSNTSSSVSITALPPTDVQLADTICETPSPSDPSAQATSGTDVQMADIVVKTPSPSDPSLRQPVALSPQLTYKWQTPSSRLQVQYSTILQ